VNDAEFEKLYAAEAPGLFAFLVYRTGDRTMAQDLVADTFERVLRARRRYDPRRGSQKAWLYAIAVNALRDQQRRSGAEVRAMAKLTDPDPVASDDHEAVLARAALAQALTGLSEEEREVIALRFGGDLTVPQIAKVLGERHTTVEGRVYRALRKLRSSMDAGEHVQRPAGDAPASRG
jgi:RNA polymerase sigma-70 factor (ECF subfamily)